MADNRPVPMPPHIKAELARLRALMVPDAEAYRRREIGSKRSEEEMKKIQPLRPLSAADTDLEYPLAAKGGSIKRFDIGGSSISIDELSRERAPTIPEQFNRYIAPHINRGMDAMFPIRQLIQKKFETNVFDPINNAVMNDPRAALKNVDMNQADVREGKLHMQNAARKTVGMEPLPQPRYDVKKVLGDINTGEFDPENVSSDKNYERLLEAFLKKRAQAKAKGGVIDMDRMRLELMNKAKGGSVMGVNVASDRKHNLNYADLIVDGHKTIESRNSDTLRPYVGKRVAIVRTGAGKAKAIGEVTIGEPIVANKKQFRNMEPHHLVPEGSTFDIKTPTKHMYPLSEPVRYDEERDVGHGIVSRKVIHKDKGGKIEVRPTVFDDAASRRNPKIEAAARALMEGEMKQKAYAKLVAKEKPVKPYEFIPKPATDEDAMRALHEPKKPKWRGHESWPAGHRVGLRLDIPAYEDHGVWVNSIHDESGGKEKLPTSYGPVSSVRNAEFQGAPHKAVRVATGEQNKAPFAKIMGELEHMDEKKAVAHMKKFLHHPDYRQIGYDPRRHGDFYDRETMEPVTHSEHVVQIGPLVLAKKPKYGKREVYAKGGATHAHHLQIEERPL